MVKKIVTTVNDSMYSAGLIDAESGDQIRLRGLEAGPGIRLEVVDADENRFITPQKKIRIAVEPGGVFRYLGTLHATKDELPSSPVRGDYWRISGFGNFNDSLPYAVNVGDGIVWNGSGWDKFDHTDPNVSGTTGRVNVTGSTTSGFVVDIDSSYVGQTSITTLGEITTGTWKGSVVKPAFGGTGTDISAFPQGSILIAGSNQVGVMPLPLTNDQVLTHVGNGSYQWKARGEINIGNNLSAQGAKVYAGKSDLALQYRTIVAGPNMIVTENPTEIVLEPTNLGEVNTASNRGVALPDSADIFAAKMDKDFEFRRLRAGQNINLVESEQYVTISSPNYTISNRGTDGVGLYYQQVDHNFEFLRLKEGNNVHFGFDGNAVVINSVDTGEVNQGANLPGPGAMVYSGKTGTDLNFRRIAAGSPLVQVVEEENRITISTTAEVTTASNLGGPDGARVFSGKVDSDLQFRRIKAGSHVDIVEQTEEIVIGMRPLHRLQDFNNDTFIEVDHDGTGTINEIEFRCFGQKAVEITPTTFHLRSNQGILGSSDPGSDFNITAGMGDATGAGGSVVVRAGRGGANGGAPGRLELISGDAGGGNVNGGDIVFTLGRPLGSGVPGAIIMRSSNNEKIAQFNTVAAASSWFSLANAPLTAGPLLTVEGAAQDINLRLMPKGAGTLILGWAKFPTMDGQPGQLLKTDGAGNLSWVSDYGEVNTASTPSPAVANSAAVFMHKMGEDLQFRRIVGGPNVYVTETAETITIASVDTGEVNVGQNIGTGVDVFESKSGTALRFRRLNPMGRVNIVQGSDTLTFSTSAELNTASNRGTQGAAVFAAKTGEDFEFRRIQASGSITVTENTNTIDIHSDAELNTASSRGTTGYEVYAGKTGVNFEFRRLQGQGAIVMTQDADSITVSTTAEANTASNVGTGTQILKGKTGVDFQFRTLKSKSSNLTVAQNGDEIELTVDADQTLASNRGVSAATRGEVFFAKTGSDLEFRRIEAGAGMNIVQDDDYITIVSKLAAMSNVRFIDNDDEFQSSYSNLTAPATIYLAPGFYMAPGMYRAGISVKGMAGAEQTVLDGDLIAAQGGQTEFENLRVTGMVNINIPVGMDYVRFSNCLISGTTMVQSGKLEMVNSKMSGSVTVNSNNAYLVSVNTMMEGGASLSGGRVTLNNSMLYGNVVISGATVMVVGSLMGSAPVSVNWIDVQGGVLVAGNLFWDRPSPGTDIGLRMSGGTVLLGVNNIPVDNRVILGGTLTAYLVG